VSDEPGELANHMETDRVPVLCVARTDANLLPIFDPFELAQYDFSSPEVAEVSQSHLR
jgi:hypothetical protein